MKKKAPGREGGWGVFKRGMGYKGEPGWGKGGGQEFDANSEI